MAAFDTAVSCNSLYTGSTVYGKYCSILALFGQFCVKLPKHGAHFPSETTLIRATGVTGESSSSVALDLTSSLTQNYVHSLGQVVHSTVGFYCWVFLITGPAGQEPKL